MNIYSKRTTGLVVLFTIVICAALAGLGGAWIRSAYRDALDQTQAIAEARRDLDVLRADESTQVTALGRYGRTGLAGDLEPYRRDVFASGVAAVANDLGRARASGALPALEATLAAHRHWHGLINGLLARDRNAVLSAASQERVAEVNEDITSIGRALDQRMFEIRDQSSQRLWIDVSVVAFIAFALAAPTVGALTLRRRLSLERSITSRLASAFGAAHLPVMENVVLDGILVPAEASDHVAGDWYDARTLPDGRLFVTIGDVAGHGVDAGVVTARLRRIMLGAAIGESDPAAVLARVNDEHAREGGLHVSTICAYYDPRMRSVSYASAGFPAPLVREARATRFLSYGGPPLGAMPNMRYERHDAVLPAGSVLIFYTDGAIEQAHDSVAGEAALAAAASRIDDASFAHRLHEALFRDTPQVDDVAILTVQTVA